MTEVPDGATVDATPMDVDSMVARTCRDVVRLERAFVDGTLARCLDSDVSTDRRILWAYREIRDRVPGPLQHLRSSAVQMLLLQFREALSPRTFVDVLTEPVPHGPETDGATASVEESPILVRLGEDVVEVTPEMVLASSFWSVGFRLDDPETDGILRRRTFRRLLERLAADLRAIGRIVESLGEGPVSPGLRLVPARDARMLDQLLLDVLNETGSKACRATLPEDFLEKTDLRVRYPSVVRRRGTRVQVTWICEESRHREKIDRIRRSDEFVFLSPLTLATFVLSIHDAARVSAGFSRRDAEEVIRAVGGDEATAEVLALRIRAHLSEALRLPVHTIAGPRERLAPSVRRLVRAFVEDTASAATTRLREREEKTGRRGRGDPSAILRSGLRVGDLVRGTVTKIVPYGAFVRREAVSGLMHVDMIPGAEAGRVAVSVSVGDEVRVRVLEIDVDRGTISFGMAAREEDEVDGKDGSLFTCAPARDDRGGYAPMATGR